MISAYKIKWAFIFCNFHRAQDRAAFKAKMKRKGYACPNLNQHNLLITCSVIERDYIYKIQPKLSTFTELRVTDKQFELIRKQMKEI